MQSTRIVLGVDGSPGSHAAAVWAAAEAVRRDAELVAVHVYEWRAIGAPTLVGGPLADDARFQAESLVKIAIEDVRSAVPDVRVRGEAVLGAVVPTLVHASDQAALGRRQPRAGRLREPVARFGESAGCHPCRVAGRRGTWTRS